MIEVQFFYFMDEIDTLEQQAINTAINSWWQEAIKLNKKILSHNKKNLPALLRLAFAYLQIEDLNRSKKYYRQAIKVQPINSVAKENLERIEILQSKRFKKTNKSKIFFNPDLFLETVGKTKSVKLVNLGQKNILAQLMVGQQIILKTKKRKVEIRTKDNDYVGSLPDDLSKRLRLFIKAKSQYSAYVKENNLNNLIIFILEEKKGKKVAGYVSFPVDLSKNISQIGEEIEKENLLNENEENLDDSPSELDLEKIAESLLTSDEKETLPYETDEDNEEE